MRPAGELTSCEFAKAMTPEKIVVVPIGAVEAHGPHLPLSTDTFIATFLAEAVRESLDVLVLPAIPYGQRTEPTRVGGNFAGAISIRAATLCRVVEEIMEAAYYEGARRFLFVHAHFANVAVIAEATIAFVRRFAEARIMAASWWDFTLEETRDTIAAETGVAREVDHHAAMLETSLMLHVKPELVRTNLIGDDRSERRVRYLVVPPDSELVTRGGVVYRATHASPEIGAGVMAEIVANLLTAVRIELVGMQEPEAGAD